MITLRKIITVMVLDSTSSITDAENLLYVALKISSKNITKLCNHIHIHGVRHKATESDSAQYHYITIYWLILYTYYIIPATTHLQQYSNAVGHHLGFRVAI